MPSTLTPTSAPITIPPAFHLRKSTILHSLALSLEAYTDLSPKGSIDAGIRPLIERLNALDGVVTTSSCAGRISVFLEGEKGPLEEGWEEGAGERAVPEGKGRGGKWLFVSHDPLGEKRELKKKERYWGRMLGVDDGGGGQKGGNMGKKNNSDDDEGGWRNLDVRRTRFVRFQFEPMILHILTASLHHAAPILSAAINAGFRESGIQSLKNLSDPQNSLPMVAVRSAGLALGAIIGYYIDSTPTKKKNESEEGVNDHEVEEQNEQKVRSMVAEEYLDVLVRLANERFEVNRDRMRRFEEGLLGRGGVELEGGDDRNEGVEGTEWPKAKVEWEDKELRRARKRAEGLAMKEATSEKQKQGEGAEEDEDYFIELNIRE